MEVALGLSASGAVTSGPSGRAKRRLSLLGSGNVRRLAGMRVSLKGAGEGGGAASFHHRQRNCRSPRTAYQKATTCSARTTK